MNKKNAFIGITIIFSLLLFASVAYAQTSINGDGWWSWIQVQRIGNSEGSIDASMKAYAPQGDSSGPWECGSRALTEFGSTATFFPHWDADPAGDNCADDGTFPTSYEGSSVLSAGDKIVAIAQTQNISYGGWAPGNDPGRANASYRGTSSPSTELIFPLYKLDHYDETTSFFIQNTGESNAELTAVFTPCKNTGIAGESCLGYPDVYTYTISGIEPMKTIVFDASLASNDGSFHPAGNNGFGGLTITSDQPIAGVGLEYDNTVTKAEFLKANRGFSPSEYGTTHYIPTVKYEYPHAANELDPRNASKWSAVMVHNTESISVTVNFTYTLLERNYDPNHIDVGNTYSVGPDEIGAGETKFYLLTHWHNPPTGTQPEDLLSAEINATGNIVVLVNEEGMFIGTGKEDLASFSGMPSTESSTKVAVPLYKEIYKKTFTGVVAQNVGDATTRVYATFYVVDSENPAISPGQTVKIYQDNIAPGSSAKFLLVCWNLFSYVDVEDGSDDLNMADLCSTPGAEPAGGSNLGVILEAEQPLIVHVTEEVPWYLNGDLSTVGDGIGIDSASYTGFPLP